MRAPKIRKFIIVANFSLKAEPDFINWIRFAIAKHVQSLEFYMNVEAKCPFWNDIFPRDDYIELPDSFYLEDTESREEIALSCVYFSPPTIELGFQGYKFLRRFFLFDCEISDEQIQSVMSTCRVLESLSIIQCSGLCFPKISGTVLKEFVFTQYEYRNTLEIQIDAPNLVILNAYCSVGEIGGFNQSCYPLEVRLFVPGGDSCLLFDGHSVHYGIDNDNDDYIHDVKRCFNAINLLSHCTQVQVFDISCAFIPLLNKALHYNGGPCNTFGSLKEFCFRWTSVQKDELVVLLSFLGDCPFLEKIQFQFGLYCNRNGMPLMIPPKREITYDDWTTAGAEFAEYDGSESDDYKELSAEDVAQLSNVTLNQLKTIELYDYYGTREQRETVKCLLMKAVCLEHLSLLYEIPKHHILDFRSDGGLRVIVQPHTKQQFLTEVSSLPRASPFAEVCLG